MISRRSFLGSIPVAAVAAPAIAQNLPAPMPIVDAGYHVWPWKGDRTENPRTLHRIWARWEKIRDRIEVGDRKYTASDIKRMMIDVVEDVTGHKPPFIIRSHDGTHNEFIFHEVSNEITSMTTYGRFEGEILRQPCYVIEWTPEMWRRIGGEGMMRYNDSLMEPMVATAFHRMNNIIYDL